MSDRAADPAVRVLVLGLSFAGGSVDASTYLGLGHVFPANMTGNTVLLAIAVARGANPDVTRSGIALAAFCGGVAVGTLALRPHVSRWPATAARTFALESLGLAALLVGWAMTSHVDALIALAAGAMGVQSAAVRVSRVGGVTTTYVTGTLTTAIARAAGRARPARSRPPSPAVPGESWLLYGLGALAGAVAVRAWHAGVVAIPLALVAASAFTAQLHRHREER